MPSQAPSRADGGPVSKTPTDRQHKSSRSVLMEPATRVLFVRVGRMSSYAGPRKGDERPQGGGKHNANEKMLGHEAFNFCPEFGGTLYGTFGIVSQHVDHPRIDLRRIDPSIPSNAGSVDEVLVIFVAPYKDGQRIAGWYRDATVHRGATPYPPNVRDRIQQHFKDFDPGGLIVKNADTFNEYRLETKTSNGVLLPEDIRRRMPTIPRGRGGTGESNVCYALKKDGAPKISPWIEGALDAIGGYHGPNLLTPEADAEAESFDVQERAAGFEPNPEIRRIVEDYAMKRAKAELRNLGFNNFTPTAAYKCYDYTCERGGKRYYVEVKGTRGAGASVILTKNEVHHWKKNQETSIAVIVHDVKLAPDGEASGGTPRVCLPWTLEPAALDMLDVSAAVGVLEAIQYKWTVPGHPEPSPT